MREQHEAGPNTLHQDDEDEKRRKILTNRRQGQKQKQSNDGDQQFRPKS